MVELDLSILYLAIAGANSMSAASIDDVFITSGACKEGSAIGESCTFTDYSQCGFTQNTTGSTLLWQTYSGGNNQLTTIPIPTDHTTGTARSW